MNDHNFNWPKKGDALFRPSVSSADQARLEAFVMPTEGKYLAGFQRAADMIVDAAKTDNRNPDDLFFPVAYLYRHHLELMLKELVRLGIRLCSLNGCEDILTNHNLNKLWNKSKQMIKEVCPDSPDDKIKATEQMIIEFHNLDSKGEAFRYARDKKGISHLQSAPQRVDLDNLKANLDGVSRFLDSAYADIDSCDPG